MLVSCRLTFVVARGDYHTRLLTPCGFGVATPPPTTTHKRDTTKKNMEQRKRISSTTRKSTSLGNGSSNGSTTANGYNNTTNIDNSYESSSCTIPSGGGVGVGTMAQQDSFQQYGDDDGYNKIDGDRDHRRRRRRGGGKGGGDNKRNQSSTITGTFFKLIMLCCCFFGFLAMTNRTVSWFRGGSSSTSSSLSTALHDFHPYHHRGTTISTQRDDTRQKHQQLGREEHRVLSHPLPEHVTLKAGKIPSIYLPQKPRTMGVYFTYPISDHQHHTPHKKQQQQQEDDDEEESHHHRIHNKNNRRGGGQHYHHTTKIIMHAQQLDPNMIRYYRTNTHIHVSEDEMLGQMIVHANSKKDKKFYRKYEHEQPDTFETDDCKRQYEWQVQSYPTCNLLLEKDLTDLHSTIHMTNPTNITDIRETPKVRLIANGYWRDVWRVIEQQQQQDEEEEESGSDTSLQGNYGPVVLKTIRYEHEYDERNYDRHRRDAVAMERLTSSRYVVDIYAFCGNSGLFQYADGGSLEDYIYDVDEEQDGSGGGLSQWNSRHKLMIAHQLASGLSDVHNFANKDGIPAIAHTDITAGQFVFIGDGHSKGIFKLNDFNRCRFLLWNEKQNKPCGFYVGSNPGTVRIFSLLFFVSWLRRICFRVSGPTPGTCLYIWACVVVG